MSMLFSFNTYSGSKKTAEELLPLKELAEASAVRVSEFSQKEKDGAKQIDVVFTALKSTSKKSGVSLIFEEEQWNTENYVFAPAALYNGNRFHSVAMEYPPMADGEELEICKKEPVISDVPRLEKDGNGRAQLGVGDLSVPCVGYFSAEKKEGVLYFFAQKNELGNFGVTVCENSEKHTARFILSAPCVREEYKYGMCTTKCPSDDSGVKLKKGDKITFSVREYRFSCDTVTDYLNTFFRLRTEQGMKRKHPNDVPWSYANEIIEEKYNARNWLESGGFYKSSEAESGNNRQWQTGWVGGTMNTLPGLIVGTDKTKDRSLRSLDFVFGKLQHKSGFLYGVFCDDKVHGDDFLHPKNTEIVMSRKNADALYFLVKQIGYLKRTQGEVKHLWENGLKKLADAFVAFYRKNGDLAQFIDIEKMTPYIAKTTSAAIAPAALALCAEYFGNPEYLKAAEEIADGYYDEYMAKGFTNGGPGEMMGCPDSESAFALLESFVVLHAGTRNEKWLKYAVDTASLCASWCVAYDYDYDRYTQFALRGVSSTGAVWANAQNKHAAPGICTLSGSSLFRLYRATGEMKYLELCRDIAHNITQFVSTPENPIFASYVWHNKPADRQKRMTAKYAARVLAATRKKSLFAKSAAAAYNAIFNPVGRINERVNLSDWEGKNNVGEVPMGSCWPEVSTMLTYLEVPAVYIQKDTGFCYAMDHVECEVKAQTDTELVVALKNLTDYDADYRLFIENQSECSAPLSDDALYSLKTVHVAANKIKELHIEKEKGNA